MTLPPKEQRVAERIAATIVSGLIEGKSPEKRFRTLCKLSGAAVRMGDVARNYGNVYGIRSGRSWEQDEQRGEADEAARILQRIAAELLEDAIDRMRPKGRASTREAGK